MSEMVRANKVTVKVVADEGFVADFYRTHKHIGTIQSSETEWKAEDDMSKIGQRESFRAYVITHANDYGIEWNPADMRTEENKRKPVYKTDEDLIDDVIISMAQGFMELVEKCKYGTKWGGMEVDEIVPMQKTARGVDLSQLGIENGKYKNTGNWAWADIKCAITIKYKKSEVYIPVLAQLVSGQLKKPKITITSLTEMIHDELISANLATEFELNPPKDKASKKGKKSNEEESKEEEKKPRKSTRKAQKKSNE